MITKSIITKEMKQKIDGELFYVMIAMIDGIKHKTSAKISDEHEDGEARAKLQCQNNLGIE